MIKKISVAEPDFSGNEKKYVLDALLKEGRISASGKYLDKFEALATEHFARKYALSCSNGTTALHLALLGLGIGPGDEVIVPVLTFASPAAVVAHCGAKPVFIDCNRNDWTIDTAQLDEKLTPRTKAIIAVDLYGMPCQHDYLADWCRKNKVFLIEDAAEAHGAYYNGKPVGSFGDISCFSFYGNKIITTGEGGICLTNDKNLYEKMKVLKNHGMRQKGIYEHEVIGYNFRLTNLQAAIGCAQFERFGQFLKKRRRIEKLYRQFLSGHGLLSFQKYDKIKIQPVCWFFNLLIDKDIEKLQKKMAEKGIETRRFFKPLHLQKAYKDFCPDKKFPNSEYLYNHGISLPASVKLTEDDIKYICNTLKRII